ncbi:MAG TPA: acyl-CoA dehydrogenase family protein [Bacillales bacterium]|nr:acyl-CoA dehydrogenase family protein [Bacillales bacterium]
MDRFVKTKEQEQRLEWVGRLADRFAERADEVDRQAAFPFENFRDLKESGYLALTVPEEYGGKNISLYDFLLLQERLGQGDASTSLAVGWHLGIFMDLADRREWEEDTLQRLCKEIVDSGVLVNRAATEPATGSPTRGGKPQTTATRYGDQWILNGRKTFTTMAPGLDYALVTATLEGTDDVGGFLVPCGSEGVRIENTWDTMGMRGTRSDDLLMENVALSDEAMVEKHESDNKKRAPMGWLLHIPACYLGVAAAAKNFAVKFAKEYKPNSLPGPIAEVPHVQQKIGEMELELLKARTLMYSTAERWDRDPEGRDGMQPDLAAVKTVATNAAVSVVDLAMRLVGGKSISRSMPLERYYRDVRAGIHNPPNDDITISVLAKAAIEEES